MIEQAQDADGARLERHPLLPRRLAAAPDSIFEPRESIGKTAQVPDPAPARRSATKSCSASTTTTACRVAETASFCQKMPSGTLDFLEEPIRDETPEAYESLRTLTDVPFAIGEEFASKWQFLPYIERGIHQFNRIDLCNVGGFTEAMKVAGWSEAHYVDLMPHNPLGPICTAATIHFSAAIAELLRARSARQRHRPLRRHAHRGPVPADADARWRRLPGARPPPASASRSTKTSSTEKTLQVLGSAPS